MLIKNLLLSHVAQFSIPVKVQTSVECMGCTCTVYLSVTEKFQTQYFPEFSFIKAFHMNQLIQTWGRFLRMTESKMKAELQQGILCHILL